MKTLRFMGHSDDTFGEYGVFNEDHDNCANGKPIVFRVTAGRQALLVVGQYRCRGTWLIGVQMWDTNEGLPAWPMRFEPEHEYSHALVIEAPDDVEVHYVGDAV